MIIGTAGHIDHGKSTLVSALTGHRMDRLAEERRRGITIALGFAPLELGDGVRAGVVDVPGHEDFVRTMVAGASGIDVALLVVAADDGVMPQTVEHLQVLEQLGISRIVPVITKADLADPEWIALLAEEVGTHLAQVPAAIDPPLAVSARTGLGLDALRTRLRELATEVERRRDDDLFRLPVDRVFSLSGAGTVVTGTAWSGRIATGERVRILPLGREARVRSVESFGTAVERSEPGARTALALVGVERSELGRGEVLVADGSAWRAVTRLDATVRLVPAAMPLRERARLWLHLGTAAVAARVVMQVGDAVRLRLESPLVARAGDRFVLRSWSPVATVGGGEVLDPAPPARTAGSLAALAAAPRLGRLALLAARRGQVLEGDDLPLLAGLPPSDAARAATACGMEPIGGRYVAVSHRLTLGRTLVATVAQHHAAAPDSAGLPLDAARRALATHDWLAEATLEGERAGGRLEMVDGALRTPGFRRTASVDPGLVARVEARIVAAGLQPPSWPELVTEFGASAEPALREAIRSGRLVAVERDRSYAPEVLARFETLVREQGAAGAITPASLRERTGMSRKFLIPLLEWCDRRGVTRREGDARVLLRNPGGRAAPA